jgi:hypothetical protein
MYRPEFDNFTSDILEIISEKKLLFVGSSGSSNTATQYRCNHNTYNTHLKYGAFYSSERLYLKSLIKERLMISQKLFTS